MLPALTPDDLNTYLQQHAIPGELVYPKTPTPTVEAAAEAVGVHPDQIIKTLLFLAVDQPVLVIANGTSRVSYRLVADYLGISKRKLNMADPDTVLAITGYPVGGVPPLGHRRPLRTIIEAGVMALPTVYGGGGSERALLRLEPAVLAKHVEAEIVDLQPPEEA